MSFGTQQMQLASRNIDSTSDATIKHLNEFISSLKKQMHSLMMKNRDIHDETEFYRSKNLDLATELRETKIKMEEKDKFVKAFTKMNEELMANHEELNEKLRIQSTKITTFENHCNELSCYKQKYLQEVEKVRNLLAERENHRETCSNNKTLSSTSFGFSLRNSESQTENPNSVFYMPAEQTITLPASQIPATDSRSSSSDEDDENETVNTVLASPIHPPTLKRQRDEMQKAKGSIFMNTRSSKRNMKECKNLFPETAVKRTRRNIIYSSPSSSESTVENE